jgi:hypothetical protein
VVLKTVDAGEYESARALLIIEGPCVLLLLESYKYT